MNRRKALVVVLCAVSVVAVVWPYGDSKAQGGNASHDFAVGGITTGFGDIFSFAAQRNPENGRVAGHVVRQSAAGLTASGPVICLTTDGNRATIGWETRHSEDPAYPVGSQQTLEVVDNGEPRLGIPTDTYDEDESPRNCSGTVPVFLPIIRGNIVVNDATP